MTASMEGRVVVVTGASSGIGRATVILLRNRGAHVVLASRSREALLEAERESMGSGLTLVTPTDVSDAGATDALIAAAVERFGRVDAVVHSAAVLAYGRFEDVPPEVFDATIGVTLLGTANVARSSLRQFARQGGGSLVVVGSLLGKIATPYMSSYVTAKWAVHGLVRCLQIEARSTPGVDVSLVSPGGVDTPVYAQAGTYVGRHGRPPPPVVTPEKVARAIVRRIDHPRRDRDVGVGPSNALTVLGFRLVPGIFDAIVTPLMRAAGLERESVDDSPGNVLRPDASGESVRGYWAGTRTAQNVGAVLVAGATGVGIYRRFRQRTKGTP
ncbi:MAG: SDR family NAD(P)-dependent oxidoreductase [Lapillicoccus sp.]